jgi:hypothetical protein
MRRPRTETVLAPASGGARARPTHLRFSLWHNDLRCGWEDSPEAARTLHGVGTGDAGHARTNNDLRRP